MRYKPADDAVDMDPSYSNMNEVYYNDQLEDNAGLISHNNDNNINSNSYDEKFNYNGASPPLLPNYYQDPHLSHHSPYTFMSAQTFYKDSPYKNYRITNDHRGQYVLKRQDVNTNLISTNER